MQKKLIIKYNNLKPLDVQVNRNLDMKKLIVLLSFFIMAAAPIQCFVEAGVTSNSNAATELFKNNEMGRPKGSKNKSSSGSKSKSSVSKSSGKTVKVKSYTRKDGTKVNAHTRKSPSKKK